MNLNAFTENGQMFEKMDVEHVNGRPGSGGEYDVQVGFGWSNGVVLEFLDRFGDKMVRQNSAAVSLCSSVCLLSAAAALL